MRYTPSEVRCLTRLLEEEHEDLDQLVKQALVELHEIRAARKRWCAIVVSRTKVCAVLGPFASSAAARKAAVEEGPSIGPDTRALIWPMGPVVTGTDDEDE